MRRKDKKIKDKKEIKKNLAINNTFFRAILFQFVNSFIKSLKYGL